MQVQYKIHLNIHILFLEQCIVNTL